MQKTQKLLFPEKLLALLAADLEKNVELFPDGSPHQDRDAEQEVFEVQELPVAL